MRRGGDGDEFVTISPPPEFQDPVTLPPPPVFRDGVQLENLDSTSSANNHPASVAQASSGTPTEKVCVTDFASKVSSDILNKAMVIVKDSPETPTAENSDISVICQSHDTSNPCTCSTAPRVV
ncbi:unnamed protein product [Orchesella dallaii]|uniref:Uncharacterized protein n=1 Tax=Orchesella dallaii TaxID=48710 RepID=A0ABP1Q825_9HEXA